MRRKQVGIGSFKMGGTQPMVFIAGPCVIESRKVCLQLAEKLKALADEIGVHLIFKASYDKANRTSHTSFRGPGIDKGLRVLAEVKEQFSLPVLTDVHSVDEVEPAAAVCDVIQLPAFLCRQTDLVLALGKSGAVINVKKAQFMAPWDMQHVIAKLESVSCRKILLTERGVSFGYNNLVADMRSLLVMKEYGYPIVFDATHSVQQPSGAGSESGGNREWAPHLARAATAIGVDGIFMETHVNPEHAKSDKANSIRFANLKKIWQDIVKIDSIIK